MSVNLFSGARRVAIVLAGVIVLGGAVIGFATKPPMKVSFQLNEPTSKPFVVDNCQANDAEKYFMRTVRGDPVYVTLCFTANKGAGGQVLIAHRPASDGFWWMLPLGSEPIRSMMNDVSSRFTLDSTMESAVLGQSRRETLRHSWTSALLTAAAVAALWLFTFVCGWVVRGFLGIPARSDRKSA